MSKHFEDSDVFRMAIMCKVVRSLHSSLIEDIGLYIGQDKILAMLLDRDGQTQSELAGSVCVQAATMTNSLKRMEKAGLIERRPDENDQRISRVYLTDAGRDMEAQLSHVHEELEATVFNSLSDDEREQLLGFVDRIYVNLREQVQG